jgi:hypothetical protein
VSTQPPLRFEQVLASEYRALRPASGVQDGDERELVARMHRDPEPLGALCISGGGIRSATFALGAVQGLAERGLLAQFDYLSTVSGGGYIGGWLTAWAHRVGGIARIIPNLCRDAPATPAGEPDPIQHLREYNSYMSPTGGALSTDVWTLIATVLRNILLNWMVLIPVLMCALMIPRLYLAALSIPERLYGDVIYSGRQPDWGALELDAVSGSPLVALVLPALSVLLLAVALFFTLRYLPGVGGRDHSRYDFSIKVLAPLVGAVLTFLTFDSLYYVGRTYVTESHLGPVVGWTFAPCVAAWLLVLLMRRGSLRERAQLLFGPLSLAVVSMAAGTGVAIWAVTNFMLWNADPQYALSWAEYVTVGPPAVLVGFVLGTVLFVGLSSRFLKDEDREWMSRAIGTILLFCVGWTGLCAMVLLLPQWAFGWRTWGHGALAAGGAASAWLSTFGGRTAAATGPSPSGRGPTPVWRSLLPRLAPPIFLALLAGGLSVLTNLTLFAVHLLTGLALSGPHGEAVAWTNHNAMLTRTSPTLLGLVALMFIGMSVVMARFVNINTFSLHGMYRDRLIRAYLGASNAERRASRFTGFAVNDDIPMHHLDPAQRPLHVLNLALNLVAGSRLAWQQRKAASFTVTASHCGSRDVGYRPSARFGGGITLGTAVAISGAAASPNMGYHSSSIVGFIMTLFNARLGSWLGNPGPAGRRTWRDPGPLSAVRSMVKEALGQTSDQSEYVYLSDGGHFENLGLYEMVRRRCRDIVVLDGGCDPDFHFDDLGNALRKIRIDLRIPIDFEDESVRPLKEQRKRWAVATIRYSAVDGAGTDGRLLYIKPMLLGNEGPDVASYAAANPSFPHQSTSDQWFDESQTESYRSLGLHTVDEICRGWKGGTISDLCRQLETEYLPPASVATTAGAIASARLGPPAAGQGLLA